MFNYYDEDAMTDPTMIETGVDGLAKTMTNDLTAKAIAEFKKASKSIYGATFCFDDFADAIAMIPKHLEDEAGLFCLINPAQKASIRKKLGDDLKYSEGFARTGYIGSVCGIPIIVSKAVPNGTAIVADRQAVTCFVKKGVETETARVADTRKNSIFARKVMLVALTDDNRVVLLKSIADPTVGYTLLETQPSDWASAPTSYYKLVDDVMTQLQTTEPFVAGKFYKVA